MTPTTRLGQRCQRRTPPGSRPGPRLLLVGLLLAGSTLAGCHAKHAGEQPAQLTQPTRPAQPSPSASGPPTPLGDCGQALSGVGHSAEGPGSRRFEITRQQLEVIGSRLIEVFCRPGAVAGGRRLRRALHQRPEPGRGADQPRPLWPHRQAGPRPPPGPRVATARTPLTHMREPVRTLHAQAWRSRGRPVHPQHCRRGRPCGGRTIALEIRSRGRPGAAARGRDRRPRPQLARRPGRPAPRGRARSPARCRLGRRATAAAHSGPRPPGTPAAMTPVWPVRELSCRMARSRPSAGSSLISCSPVPPRSYNHSWPAPPANPVAGIALCRSGLLTVMVTVPVLGSIR